MKNNRQIYPGVGISSILMIFVILCLTAFGILSFSTARSDWQLTQKNVQSIQSYYDADAKAQEVLAQTDLELARLLRENPSFSNRQLASHLNGQLIMDTQLSIPKGSSGTELIFSVPVGSMQKIQVKLELVSESQRYRILSYHLSPSEEWSGENQPLDVWDGVS
ncbi:hypothetical protein [Clostridium minihomine]|uniref:hypothetical protein n=1 Tax=Clostridium minihomine TaxID=2045012 RepID=UPI000C7887E7|nr:hypothetical protein [Clostridium minihomine]